MDTVTQDAIVLDDSSGVDDTRFTDARAHVDRGLGEEHGTGTDLDASPNIGRRVHYVRHLVTQFRKTPGELQANAIVPDRNDHRRKLAKPTLARCRDADNWPAPRILDFGKSVVKEGNPVPCGAFFSGICNDPAMPPGTYDQQTAHSSVPLNFALVTCPSWVMPLAPSTSRIVATSILQSNHKV